MSRVDVKQLEQMVVGQFRPGTLESADGAICVVSTQAAPLLFPPAKKSNQKQSRDTEWLG